MTSFAPADSFNLLPLTVSSLRFEIAGKTLLDGVSFVLEEGRPTCVVGPNGAGKSLLLRLCHGLLMPTAGSVSWAGGTPDQQRRAQAMVFQRPVLLRRSVLANIDHALAARGVPREERAARAALVLEKTGLVDIAERSAKVLSGGEQQRLALARAWALKPKLLFLDEPTAHLDPAATASVESIIAEMDEDQIRIVMVSHDLGQVRRVGADVLFLNQGKLIEHTATPRFFDSPQTDLAAAFVRGQLLW